MAYNEKKLGIVLTYTKKFVFEIKILYSLGLWCLSALLHLRIVASWVKWLYCRQLSPLVRMRFLITVLSLESMRPQTSAWRYWIVAVEPAFNSEAVPFLQALPHYHLLLFYLALDHRLYSLLSLLLLVSMPLLATVAISAVSFRVIITSLRSSPLVKWLS